MPTPFRAADIVYHAPSKETWVLAVDEFDGRVMPVGWPESLAQAADCTLKKAASGAARKDMLETLAKKTGSDYRCSRAREDLRLDALSKGIVQ